MDEIINNYTDDDEIKLPDDNAENNVEQDVENTPVCSEEQEEEYFKEQHEPVEEQHDHAPAEIEPEIEEYEGYDDDDEGVEENNNELDEEAINSFILQLFQLKKNNLLKKRESKLIPSVNKYLKLDFVEKGEKITPFDTKNLLHICELIL